MDAKDQMKLSILTPAIPSRMRQLDRLTYRINRQIADLPVEHLILVDNKRRSVGLKRDALLRAARGKYVAFVDDDDDIDWGYVTMILEATEKDPDVITFKQKASIDGVKGIIEFKLGNANEGFYPEADGTVKRNAWHVCAWRRTLAILSRFPDSNYGEDWKFAAPLCQLAKTEVHIPSVLHYYNYDSKVSEAQPEAGLASDAFRQVSGQ